jgi:hypothetical protein
MPQGRDGRVSVPEGTSPTPTSEGRRRTPYLREERKGEQERSTQVVSRDLCH